MRSEGFSFIMGVRGLDRVRLAWSASSFVVVAGSAESRNLPPLSEAFGEVCRCRVIVRFVAHTVALGRRMWEDEVRMSSPRKLRSHIGIGV